MKIYLIQNLPDPHGPAPVPSGPITSFRPTGYSTAATELTGFKKVIKREIAAYPSLKEERYFDGFKRSLFIVVAKSHECNEVVYPTYIPGSEPEQQELLEAKQTFMFSVFNADLQTDMDKTIVRRCLNTTDAQSVWTEISEHMRASSKGASEKRRLTQYATNTVLDDNFKGTTNQFVLHFNEQFRHSRSLPSWTLLAVLWQMCHVWIPNWIVSGSVKVTDRLSYTRGKFAILHAPECFVAVLPCLEHLQDV